MSLLASHIIFQIYTTYTKTVQKLWAINTALSIYLKLKNIWSFLCQYHSLVQRWTLLLKSHGFGIIRKLDVNQYIFPYTFNQTSAMTCELFSQSLFLKSFTPLKNRIICLIRSHALTTSRPTRTVVVIQSDCSYCQVFSSAYFLYILFLPIFQYFRVFIVQMTYAGCSLVIHF